MFTEEELFMLKDIVEFAMDNGYTDELDLEEVIIFNEIAAKVQAYD